MSNFPVLGLQDRGEGGGGVGGVLVDCFPQLVFNCLLSSCNTTIKMCGVQLRHTMGTVNTERSEREFTIIPAGCEL